MSIVVPVTINAPGQWGVNEQERDQLLHPNWATIADSLVLNDSGRLQCRGALTLVSSDGATAEILRQFVYVTAAGVETVISTTATKIISGIADLDDASTDITSATTPTNGFWKFANFNGKVLGWQAGHTPIVKTSGDFADIVAASGTLPDGDAMVAAFGRVWASDDDGQTIRYSALLDETRWDAADGGGSIDMRNVWTQGIDRVMALHAFGSNLVIFGRKHIIFYTDGQGSTLGVDPEQMYVVDTIEGTGCVARDTVVSIGEGDVVFLSEVGLQSLRRIVVQKDNPLVDISWQIAARLTAAIATEIVSATDTRTWTGHYIPATGQYMLVHTTTEDVYAFHMGGRTQDEKGREITPITIWDTSVLTNIRGFITLRTGVTYTSGSATHEIYKYDTAASLDQGNTAIDVDYESGWIKTEQPQYDDIQKTLKFATLTLSNEAAINSAVTLKYGTDYKDTLDSKVAPAANEEQIVNLYDTTGDIEGQHFKFGVSDTSFGLKVLQQLVVYMSPGRTAMTHVKENQDYDNTAVDGPQFIGPPLSGSVTAASGATSATIEDLIVPSDADGFVLLIHNSVGFGADAARFIGATYGGEAVLISEGNMAGPDGSSYIVIMTGSPVSPSSGDLALTFTDPGATDVITAYIYPFRDLPSSTINLTFDSVTWSAGYTPFELTIDPPTAAHNTVVLVVADYAAAANNATVPWTVTVDDTRLRFVDSRLPPWGGNSEITLNVYVYEDIDGTAVTPSIDAEPTTGSKLVAFILEYAT